MNRFGLRQLSFSYVMAIKLDLSWAFMFFSQTPSLVSTRCARTAPLSHPSGRCVESFAFVCLLLALLFSCLLLAMLSSCLLLELLFSSFSQILGSQSLAVLLS